MRERKGAAVCYAVVPVSGDTAEMEAAAMKKARRLWPEGPLTIARVYPCSDTAVMYEVTPEGGK